MYWLINFYVKTFVLILYTHIVKPTSCWLESQHWKYTSNGSCHPLFLFLCFTRPLFFVLHRCTTYANFTNVCQKVCPSIWKPEKDTFHPVLVRDDIRPNHFWQKLALMKVWSCIKKASPSSSCGEEPKYTQWLETYACQLILYIWICLCVKSVFFSHWATNEIRDLCACKGGPHCLQRTSWKQW